MNIYTMTVFKTLSADVIGFAFILASAAVTMWFPEVPDFWLALATSITLFLIMYIRPREYLETLAEEKTTP